MKTLFLAMCFSLFACSAPVLSEDTGTTEQADNNDPNAVGIPDGCRIEYLSNDPQHLHPIMNCEFFNYEAKLNSPDPVPFQIEAHINRNK